MKARMALKTIRATARDLNRSTEVRKHSGSCLPTSVFPISSFPDMQRGCEHPPEWACRAARDGQLGDLVVRPSPDLVRMTDTNPSRRAAQSQNHRRAPTDP